MKQKQDSFPAAFAKCSHLHHSPSVSIRRQHIHDRDQREPRPPSPCNQAAVPRSGSHLWGTAEPQDLVLFRLSSLPSLFFLLPVVGLFLHKPPTHHLHVGISTLPALNPEFRNLESCTFTKPWSLSRCWRQALCFDICSVVTLSSFNVDVYSHHAGGSFQLLYLYTWATFLTVARSNYIVYHLFVLVTLLLRRSISSSILRSVLRNLDT